MTTWIHTGTGGQHSHRRDGLLYADVRVRPNDYRWRVFVDAEPVQVGSADTPEDAQRAADAFMARLSRVPVPALQ